MLALPAVAAMTFAWTALCLAIDRRNARLEGQPAISPAAFVVTLLVATAGVLLSSEPQRLGVGLALGGLGIAAAGDLRHGYLWQEITVPTLFAVVGASVLAGVAPVAAAGAAALGALALLVYFACVLTNRDAGFGDVVPTAVVGAALGPVYGLVGFALACALFGIVAFAIKKRLDVALPFGPAIAAAVLIGPVIAALATTLR